MKIVIAGGTGFLGRPLAASLAGHGHAATILSRGKASSQDGIPTVTWTPDASVGPWAAALDGADAIVNLAGESIAGRRWTTAQKQRILDSRVRATASLVGAIAQARVPPSVL